MHQKHIGIDLDRHALANEADSDHEMRSGGLPNQEPSETLEGTASNLNCHLRLQEWIRIDRKGAGDQTSHAFDLSIRNTERIRVGPICSIISA